MNLDFRLESVATASNAEPQYENLIKFPIHGRSPDYSPAADRLRRRWRRWRIGQRGNPGPYAYAYTYTYTYADTDTDANANANADANTYADPYAYANPVGAADHANTGGSRCARDH